MTLKLSLLYNIDLYITVISMNSQMSSNKQANKCHIKGQLLSLGRVESHQKHNTITL